ncbi:hypothetical protein KXW88_009483 [Aspergillus fumigatus]|nr:hypothetical protein KXW88_009483 [Aspergillus fumigatus]KAH3200240.1 hypothetical protein KXW62_000373 [Aspergillus fumigatus]
MAFPYSQSPPYDAPAPDLNPSGGSYYTPQDAPHGYGAQQPYGQPGQLEQYTSVHTTQHDLSPQAQHYQPPPPRDFLSPSDALGYQHEPRNYEARGRQGSNAEYYNQHTDEHRNVSRSRRSRSRASSSAMKDRSGSRSRSRSGSSGQDRGLAGTLMGGASGYYLGHKQSHGLLGALGGALLGNFLEHQVEEHKEHAAVSSHLHICLPTPLALLSSILGTLSIISWLFAQLPQIYKNYQLQSTSGLSLFFLVEWCLGDTGNLVGALFTRQAAWQVIIAAYYVLVDVTLVFQFFWYTHYKGRRVAYGGHSHSHSHHGEDAGSFLEGVPLSEEDSITDIPPRKPATEGSATKDEELLKKSSPITMNHQPLLYTNEKLSSSRRTITRSSSGPSLPLASTRTLLLASMLCAVVANAQPTEHHLPPAASQQTTLLVGRISSWISTALYLGSRPPQLIKNYRRKSTAGLSPLLFMAAFCGNLFYSASLATNPNAWYDFPPWGGRGWAGADGNKRLEWVGLSIPFFLGAFGVLFLDGCMGLQFLMYGAPDEEQVVPVMYAERRSRWTRVRGWMRGWIPSVPPRRASHDTSVQESQALLRGERERYGTVHTV